MGKTSEQIAGVSNVRVIIRQSLHHNCSVLDVDSSFPVIRNDMFPIALKGMRLMDLLGNTCGFSTLSFLFVLVFDLVFCIIIVIL